MLHDYETKVDNSKQLCKIYYFSYCNTEILLVKYL